LALSQSSTLDINYQAITMVIVDSQLLVPALASGLWSLPFLIVIPEGNLLFPGDAAGLSDSHDE
jgi:hypothetical protein